MSRARIKYSTLLQTVQEDARLGKPVLRKKAILLEYAKKNTLNGVFVEMDIQN